MFGVGEKVSRPHSVNADVQELEAAKREVTEATAAARSAQKAAAAVETAIRKATLESEAAAATAADLRARLPALKEAAKARASAVMVPKGL